MSSKRAFFIMIGVLGASFCLLIAGAVAGDFLLKKQSDKLLSLKLDNRVLDEQQIALVQANKDIQKYSDLETIANTIVPQDKDQAKTVREIVNIAAESNIPIASIAFPSSTLGQSAPVSTGTGTTSSTPKITTPSITQVTPVTGMTGVYQMEITVQSDTTKPVPYSSLIDFLSKLENNRRTAQVSNMTILPYSKDISQVTFTLGINVFIKP